MQNLADIFMGAVQYNEEGVFMSISDLCEVMTCKNGTYENGQNAYNSLVKLAQVFNTHLPMIFPLLPVHTRSFIGPILVFAPTRVAVYKIATGCHYWGILLGSSE